MNIFMSTSILFYVFTFKLHENINIFLLFFCIKLQTSDLVRFEDHKHFMIAANRLYDSVILIRDGKILIVNLILQDMPGNQEYSWFLLFI
jgi:hypothetical protein